MKRVFAVLLAVCLLTGCVPLVQEASAPAHSSVSAIESTPAPEYTAASAHTPVQPTAEPISTPAAEFEPETSPDPAYPYAMTKSRYAACFQPNEADLNGDGLTDTWQMLETDGYYEGIEIVMGGSDEKRILSRSEELEEPMELTACVTGDFTGEGTDCIAYLFTRETSENKHDCGEMRVHKAEKQSAEEGLQFRPVNLPEFGPGADRYNGFVFSLDYVTEDTLRLYETEGMVIPRGEEIMDVTIQAENHGITSGEMCYFASDSIDVLEAVEHEGKDALLCRQPIKNEYGKMIGHVWYKMNFFRKEWVVNDRESIEYFPEILEFWFEPL